MEDLSKKPAEQPIEPPKTPDQVTKRESGYGLFNIEDPVERRRMIAAMGGLAVMSFGTVGGGLLWQMGADNNNPNLYDYTRVENPTVSSIEVSGEQWQANPGEVSAGDIVWKVPADETVTVQVDPGDSYYQQNNAAIRTSRGVGQEASRYAGVSFDSVVEAVKDNPEALRDIMARKENDQDGLIWVRIDEGSNGEVVVNHR